MRWVVIIGAVAVLLVAALLVVGLMQPAGHSATTRARIAAPPAQVWAAVAGWQQWPEWQSSIRSVERLADRDGHMVLMTGGSWGDVRMEIVESEEDRRLVTAVDAGGFSGRWTYLLEPDGPGTLLTITEDGSVTNPLFRAMMLFHDNYATMLDYDRALGERLGVPVDAEPVEE